MLNHNRRNRGLEQAVVLLREFDSRKQIVQYSLVSYELRIIDYERISKTIVVNYLE